MAADQTDKDSSAEVSGPEKQTSPRSDRPQKSSRTASFKRKDRQSADRTSEGRDFERRVGRLEFAEGALARLRVPVFVDAEAGRTQLTDLDVVAIDFDSRLQISRSMLECKSGSGQSGEGDRLLWLAGLRAFVRADRAVLVRQTITRRGHGIASSLGLQILDSSTLERRESAHGWLPERFAHIDGPACEAAENRLDTQLKALGHVPAELVSFLRFNVLFAAPHRILGALVELSGVTERGGVLPLPTRTVLAGHALQALTLAGLQYAVALDTLPLDRLKRRTELALTVGAPDDDHLLSVLGLADQLLGQIVNDVHRKYINEGAQRIEVAVPSLRDLVGTPPAWIDKYLDFVQRLRSNPAIARQLPQTIELACFDGLLGDTAYTATAFDHLFTREHRSLLAACIRMLSGIVPAQLIEAVSPAADLDFTRTAPALPDRAAPAAALPTEDSAHVARPAQQ